MLSIKKIMVNALIFAACFLPGFNVYASTLNPATGDNAGRYMPIFIAVAVVALIGIIISIVTSKKK